VAHPRIPKAAELCARVASVLEVSFPELLFQTRHRCEIFGDVSSMAIRSKKTSCSVSLIHPYRYILHFTHSKCVDWGKAQFADRILKNLY